MQNLLIFLGATLETFLRGFLLGFGTMICKDLLLSKDSLPSAQPTTTLSDAADKQPNSFSYSFTKAKLAGLGAGSFLVGSAIIIPHSLRQKYLM